MMTVTKIGAFSEKGIPMGDNCEFCETEAKPIYHIENPKFEIDIILCPKCIEKFKKDVTSISI